jgi:hypothetical protein
VAKSRGWLKDKILESVQTWGYIFEVVQDTLNEALQMIEDLLAKCERGKDSRALAAEVGAILESVEAAHSEAAREAQSAKRTGALLENELRRNAKLQEQIAVLIKIDRPPIFLPAVANGGNPSAKPLKQTR